MRHIQKQVRVIINDVAAKHGVSSELVEDIYATQFEFVVFNMEKGNKFKSMDGFENIYLRHLGTFIASEKCVKRMMDIDKKLRHDNDQGSELGAESDTEE